jgi:hypothetical protein
MLSNRDWFVANPDIIPSSNLDYRAASRGELVEV